ncbi:hypothetical protein D3C86_1489810 [compost metagenome]
MKRKDERGVSSTETDAFTAHGFEPTINTAEAMKICLLIGRCLKVAAPRDAPKIISELREGVKGLAQDGCSATELLLLEGILASLADPSNSHEGEGRNLAAAMQRLKIGMARH